MICPHELVRPKNCCMPGCTGRNASPCITMIGHRYWFQAEMNSTMAAVANAVANAVGEMLPQIPMTPWRLLRVIRYRRKRPAAARPAS